MSLSRPRNVDDIRRELLKQYQQETESNYVATLLVRLIESESEILSLVSIDKRYYSGQPDIYCEYKIVDGILIIEIKSQRAHEGIHLERKREGDQLKRYLNFCNTNGSKPKQICDVVTTLHSADVEYTIKELIDEDKDIESYMSSNLCFLCWEIVEMIPQPKLRIRYCKGTIDQGQVLAQIKASFNGYEDFIAIVLEEMQSKNVTLLPQNDQSIMVIILEKVWELYNPMTKFMPRPPNPKIPKEDYFLECNTLFFSISCMDWALNGESSESRPYCAKIPRRRIREICEFMKQLDLLITEEENGRIYYGSSLFRRPRNYSETVCQALAEYQHNEGMKAVGQMKLSDFLKTGHRV